MHGLLVAFAIALAVPVVLVAQSTFTKWKQRRSYAAVRDSESPWWHAGHSELDDEAQSEVVLTDIASYIESTGR